MITEQTIKEARTAVEELRRRGESDRAEAIEALIDAVRDDVVPALDLLTTTQTGNLLGVSGQTIKNWVRGGTLHRVSRGQPHHDSQSGCRGVYAAGRACA